MDAAINGDVSAIKILVSSGVDVTGSLDLVSMCVAIQYSVLYDDNCMYTERVSALHDMISQ